MDAAEVLADQFARGEQVLGQGSIECSAVAVREFSTFGVLDVKRGSTPIRSIFGDPVQKGVVVALGSAALFGISTPLAKILTGTVSPLLLAGLLYAGSGLGLSLLLAARRWSTLRESSFSLPRGGDWIWLSGAIVLGGVVGPVALMYGLVTSAASTASLLLNLEAAFTALLAWFLFHENFDRRVIAGMS